MVVVWGGSFGIPGALRCPPAPRRVGSRGGDFVLAAPRGLGLQLVKGELSLPGLTLCCCFQGLGLVCWG